MLAGMEGLMQGGIYAIMMHGQRDADPYRSMVKVMATPVVTNLWKSAIWPACSASTATVPLMNLIVGCFFSSRSGST